MPPVFRHGDMFTQSRADAIIVTCNSTINSRGALVMGRGAARQLRNKHRGIDAKFAIQYLRAQTYGDDYNLLFQDHRGKTYGILQVKRRWDQPAIPAVIKASLECLMEVALYTANTTTYALNYPGIGNGSLSPDIVAPMLEILPGNVEVWTWGGERDGV